MCCMLWKDELTWHCWAVLTKTCFVRERLICVATPGLQTHTQTNTRTPPCHNSFQISSEMRTCPGQRCENGRQRQNEKEKTEKDRDGNKMKEKKSQRGEHRVIKGQTRRESEREQEGGCGSACRVSGVKQLCFIVMSQLLPSSPPRSFIHPWWQRPPHLPSTPPPVAI